jgi:hypothetical protein
MNIHDDELIKNISAILFNADPININCVENTDEYDDEARSIVRLINNAKSVDELHVIIYDVFCLWFDEELAGNKDKYYPIAETIWKLWIDHSKLIRAK